MIYTVRTSRHLVGERLRNCAVGHPTKIGDSLSGGNESVPSVRCQFRSGFDVKADLLQTFQHRSRLERWCDLPTRFLPAILCENITQLSPKIVSGKLKREPTHARNKAPLFAKGPFWR